MNIFSRVAYRVLSLACVLACSNAGWVSAEEAFRPPAVPLVTCDPYFSIWSRADELMATCFTILNPELPSRSWPPE